MRNHPYLRAYLAGILAPTLFLPILLGILIVVRGMHSDLARVVVFGMAVVPNVWGLWNMIHFRWAGRWNIPLGAWGAILPLLILPMGYSLLRWHLEMEVPPELISAFPFALPAVVIAYYLLWKYAVGFLNGLLGVAKD